MGLKPTKYSSTTNGHKFHTNYEESTSNASAEKAHHLASRIQRVPTAIQSASLLVFIRVHSWLNCISPAEEHFHRQFNLNVLGLILASQEALKYF